MGWINTSVGEPVNCTQHALKAFIFSLDAEEGSFATSSSAIAPSAPLRSTPTASACLCSGKPKVSSHGSPSLGTSQHGTQPHGEELSISSRADFPVPAFPPQAKVEAFQILAQGYGQSSPSQLGLYDPVTHSLRTPQRCLFEDSQQSLLTLPRWGWMHGGVVWGLMTSAPGIGASGRGFLPTATVTSQAQLASDLTPGQPGGDTLMGGVLQAAGMWIEKRLLPTRWRQEPGRTSQGYGRGLRELMEGKQQLPTPTTGDRYTRTTRYAQGGTPLSLAVILPTITASMQTVADFMQAKWAGSDPARPSYADAKHLPTPRAQERQQHNSQDAYVALGKRVQLQMYATASASPWRAHKASEATMNRNSRPLNEQVGGSLNPTWECWYMGWPMDWEALGTSPTCLTSTAFQQWLLGYRTALSALWHLATGRSRCVPRWPGRS
mgnify:CR=1 FL=1